ncbi:hypothetical protein KI387_013802, partial [Taxus chinensis]
RERVEKGNESISRSTEHEGKKKMFDGLWLMEDQESGVKTHMLESIPSLGAP